MYWVSEKLMEVFKIANEVLIHLIVTIATGGKFSLSGQCLKHNINYKRVVKFEGLRIITYWFSRMPVKTAVLHL